MSLLCILTDRGTEYCGKPENHAYQLYLEIENIDHSRTKANSLQTNGICERFIKLCKMNITILSLERKSTVENVQKVCQAEKKVIN